MSNRSPLSITETDRVTIRKPDGTVVRENIPALVTQKGIQISDTSVPICVDDIIERKLPSGLVDEFLVLDPGYHASPHPGLRIDRYMVKYRRTDAPPRPPYGVTFNNSHFGGNSRVNLNSVDKSQNTIGATSGDVAEIFAAVRAATENITSLADRERIAFEVTNLEAAHGTPSFFEQYARFVAVLADHITLFSPLLPALAALGGIH